MLTCAGPSAHHHSTDFIFKSRWGDKKPSFRWLKSLRLLFLLTDGHQGLWDSRDDPAQKCPGTAGLPCQLWGCGSRRGAVRVRLAGRTSPWLPFGGDLQGRCWDSNSWADDWLSADLHTCYGGGHTATWGWQPQKVQFVLHLPLIAFRYLLTY